MTSDELTTVSDVVKALGGSGAVAEKTKNAVSAVSNWRKTDKFPADTYILIKGELEAVGKTAPDALWSMRVAERAS